MTVTYTAEVATVRGLGCFLKLLRRWRGSIYKLVWIDLLLFLSIYYTLNFMYRFLLDEAGKELFQNVVVYCKDYCDLIPISFVLGFYVSIVMTRWWGQYSAIPFPDPLAVFVSATVHGQDERGRVMRRTIMRYVCLCVTMTFTMISPKVKKRFPTYDTLVAAGLLQESEKDIITDLDKKFPDYSKQWLPIVWAASIITRARKEGRIRDDFAVKTIIDELNKFRGKCGLLLNYDHISLPLVYTQVVTLAVYSYFLSTVMGHQWVEGNKYKFDLYFPVFTLLQFFFYMGWLKVAESLINPFGDDDDDFELNWMVDRNLQVSYLIVDEMHHEHPELVKDQYWDEVFPASLPYTAESAPFKESHPLPSTANISVKPDVEPMTPSSIKIDDMNYNDLNSGPIMFSAGTHGGAYSSSVKSRGSQASLGQSVTDAMTRVNSVSSMLKRFFSREDSRTDKQESIGGSAQELAPLTTVPSKYGESVRKLTDEVIEEVDEQQQTINSLRGANDPRPTVMNLFSPPVPSQPIDVPRSLPYRNHSDSHDIYPTSTSAPETQDNPDKVSIGGSLTDSESDDEFSRLKKKRSQERLSRLKMNLVRSISNTGDFDQSELLLHRRSSSNTNPTPRTSLDENAS